MILIADRDPPGFGQWLTAKVGRWVVADRLTPRLVSKGYVTALTQGRYNRLRAEWLGHLMARTMLGAK